MTKDELSEMDSEKVLLIDIREGFELESLPTPKGAIHIPMNEIPMEIDNDNLPKDKKIVTICRSGGRCQIVNEFLIKRGYEADFIEGGISAFD